jgi:sulfane dehydrogenase subunit SoxC
MIARSGTVAELSGNGVSRRRLLIVASTGVGSVVAGAALAETLADVPPREPGAPLSGHSE